MNLNTKQEYPDLSWLKELPKDWKCVNLWTIAQLKTERNPGNLELLSVYLNYGVIPFSEGGGLVHAPSLDLSNYQVVRPGYLVLNNQQAWRGSVGVSNLHGIISPAYIVLELSEGWDRTYANYLFRSSYMIDQFLLASRGVGTIQRQIHYPSLRTTKVPIPPVSKQKKIADFLNQRLEPILKPIKFWEYPPLKMSDCY
jgi:type I restriction enzyme, S subunit